MLAGEPEGLTDYRPVRRPVPARHQSTVSEADDMKVFGKDIQDRCIELIRIAMPRLP